MVSLHIVVVDWLSQFIVVGGCVFFFFFKAKAGKEVKEVDGSSDLWLSHLKKKCYNS